MLFEKAGKRQMKSAVNLSLVITALNEEENVKHCLETVSLFLQENFDNYEIVFVNDGSTDSTGSKLESMAHLPNLKIIHLEKNQGTGGAVKEALKKINGDWYCWLPSDLEIRPEEILKAIRHCESSDLIVTYIENGHEARTSFRNILSWGFVQILNASFSHKLKYYNGPALIRTSKLSGLSVRSNRFFFHAELLLKVLKRRPKMSEVGIVLTPRHMGQSKAIKLRVFLDVMKCYLTNVWELRVRDENPHC